MGYSRNPASRRIDAFKGGILFSLFTAVATLVVVGALISPIAFFFLLIPTLLIAKVLHAETPVKTSTSSFTIYNTTNNTTVTPLNSSLNMGENFIRQRAKNYSQFFHAPTPTSFTASSTQSALLHMHPQTGHFRQARSQKQAHFNNQSPPLQIR